MPPSLSTRGFAPWQASQELSAQWTAPGDVFSILLLLGGDVINRALAQVTGSGVTPVAFSFGWVAYAVSAVVAAVGENKLLPPTDCACKVINAQNGYVRDNESWVLGRVLRDFDAWCHQSVKEKVKQILDEKWSELKGKAGNTPRASQSVARPTQAGLCVSVYLATGARVGYPGYDLVYYSGFVVMALQLGVAAIPFGLYGDWSILLITGWGTVLSFATGWLPQWKKEKWACRLHSYKSIIITRGQGSQHALAILGNGHGFDLEDLAAGAVNVDAFASFSTRVFVIFVAILWTLLLITAAGIKLNTWFLLAVGGIGMLHNIFIAGKKRNPAAFGMPLAFESVYGEAKAMKTLYAVERDHPGIGRHLLPMFFPGEIRDDEKAKWAQLGVTV